MPAEDATPLALVLTELVTNAVEHGLAGGESGTVEVVVDAAGRRRCGSMVRDDGDGLPEERRRRRHGLGTQIVHDAGDQRDARHDRVVAPRGRRHGGGRRGCGCAARGTRRR